MRYVFVVIGLVLVVGSLVGVKYTQISSLIGYGKKAQAAGPPPETVSTAPSREEKWEGALSSVGSITAAKGVTVSNDAPGVVSAIRFESGAVVKQGQVLVELDSRVERAQLASAVARKDLAALNVGRSRALVASAAIPKAQLDTDESLLKSSNADLGALQAQIDRKTVRAPFAGRLGIRAVNIGQYLNPGTSLTVLEAIDAVYVDFTLPQQRLAEVSVGMPVHVVVQGVEGVALDGKIAAIDPSIDSATRTIKLRATVPNTAEKLRPGMFATVSVVLPDRGTVVTIPATALVHASYGDSVYVVEDKKDDKGAPVLGADGAPAKIARQQFVRVGEARGDFVVILDGVTKGLDIVTAGAFKLRNGASVVVNNDVKQTPELAPHPTNR